MISIQLLQRFIPRAKRIMEMPDLHVAFKGLSPVMLASIEAFEVAHQVVLKEEEMVAKERAEAKAALAALRKEIDIVRMAAQPSLPHADLGPAATAYTTNDDLLGAGERIEDILTEEGEEWVALNDNFGEVLSVAVKEWGEVVAASASLQKARDARHSAAQACSEALVDFRRLVRVVFGSSSQEYHSLRVRRRKGEEG